MGSARDLATRSVRDGDCLRWTGAHTQQGYGQIRIDTKVIAVHRLAYEVAVGAIPDGYVIDHVRERGCRFRDCIEPRHLEAVTQAENVARIPSERLRYEAASPQPTYEARAVERFLAKCVVDGTTGCWNWISDPKWAPRIRIHGRNHRAGRWFYMLGRDPLPPQSELVRTCDNRGCVNPQHLTIRERTSRAY